MPKRNLGAPMLETKCNSFVLFNSRKWRSSNEVYSGCSSAEERQFDWVFLERGRSKRESLEFHLFIGLVIFLCFPFSYCQRGIWKWNMYLDKLLFLLSSWARFACVCIPWLWPREMKAPAARLAILSRWATQYYSGERSREERRGGEKKKKTRTKGREEEGSM